MTSFVKSHFKSNDDGSTQPHSLSTNKPSDIEIWVQGEVSKTWFTPEFILDKESGKIRATVEFTRTRPAARWDHLIALMRVVASGQGF